MAEPQTAAAPRIELIVGIGNPGERYHGTRHNIGWQFVDLLASQGSCRWQSKASFHGDLAETTIEESKVRLLKPQTHVNNSGRAVQAVAHFYRIPSEAILVVHDDLDLPPGSCRLRFACGDAGHNGLRDISRQLTPNYHRLRFGIGHPGQRDQVTPWVLGRPSASDREAMERALDLAHSQIDSLCRGDFEQGMRELNCS